MANQYMHFSIISFDIVFPHKAMSKTVNTESNSLQQIFIVYETEGKSSGLVCTELAPQHAKYYTASAALPVLEKKVYQN